MSARPFFLDTGDGYRFCIHHPPRQDIEVGAVVYLHPFAEEMHKSRRMAALQSRALASAGFHVLQIDLLGCGDSSGDFGDATWEAWIDDGLRAVAWLTKTSSAPLWLWGLRTGGLLAGDIASRIAQPGRLVLWNPVVSGRQYLLQFLRLKLAGEMMSGDAKGGMARIRESLDRGESVEVAGYLLNPTMARSLETKELAPPPLARMLYWFDTAPRAEPELSPAVKFAIERWTSAGSKAEGIAVSGPTFWQTTEIEDAPALLDATLARLVREK